LSERIDALILDSRERGSLAVARALGPSGYRLAMGGYSARDPGLFTRYAHLRTLFTPPSVDIDRYAQEIVDWLSEHPCDATLASSDQTATAVGWSAPGSEIAGRAMEPPTSSAINRLRARPPSMVASLRIRLAAG